MLHSKLELMYCDILTIPSPHPLAAHALGKCRVPPTPWNPRHHPVPRSRSIPLCRLCLLLQSAGEELEVGATEELSVAEGKRRVRTSGMASTPNVGYAET